jgi:hypothetical protein
MWDRRFRLSTRGSRRFFHSFLTIDARLDSLVPRAVPQDRANAGGNSIRLAASPMGWKRKTLVVLACWIVMPRKAGIERKASHSGRYHQKTAVVRYRSEKDA